MGSPRRGRGAAALAADPGTSPFAIPLEFMKPVSTFFPPRGGVVSVRPSRGPAVRAPDAVSGVLLSMLLKGGCGYEEL
jgi:hypothetical protein